MSTGATRISTVRLNFTVHPAREEGESDLLEIVPRDAESALAMYRALARAPAAEYVVELYRDAVEQGIADERMRFTGPQVDLLARGFERAGDENAARDLRKRAARLEGQGRSRLDELLAEATAAVEGPEVGFEDVRKAVRKLAVAIRLAVR